MFPWHLRCRVLLRGYVWKTKYCSVFIAIFKCCATLGKTQLLKQSQPQCCYCAIANVTWSKVKWNPLCCSLRSRSTAASTQTSPPSSRLELFSGQWLVCHRTGEPFCKKCHQSCPLLTPAASPSTWLLVWQRSPLCWRGRRGFWTGAGWQVRNEKPQPCHTFDAFDLCLLFEVIEVCLPLQQCNQPHFILFLLLQIYEMHFRKNGSNCTRDLILISKNKVQFHIYEWLLWGSAAHKKSFL